MASHDCHKRVVESLLSAGADIHHQNNVCDIYYCNDESCFYVLFL